MTDIGSLFSRHGRVSIVLAKFVPGFGIMLPPLAGSMGVSPLRFLLLDALGALAWTGSHLLLGYLFRKNLERSGVCVLESRRSCCGIRCYSDSSRRNDQELPGFTY